MNRLKLKRASVILMVVMLGLALVASTVSAREITASAINAAGPTTITGVTGGGAHYRIVVPDPWNGDLVIWNHGFSLSPPGPVNDGSDLGPLASLQLAEGYAVAASSYQQAGWALFKTKNDLQHMVNVFESNFGAPNQVIVTGGSLGGIVTAQALEKADLGNVVGAYTICGAMAGSRNWDAAIDIRLVYDAIAANTPSAFIPGGAEGLPEGSTLTPAVMAFRVNEAFGILLPDAARSATQKANLALFLAVTQIPENFVLTDMGFATFGLSDLIHDTHKLNGKIGLGNADVDYGDASINSNITRVSPHPGGENRLSKNFTPTGDVGDVKIVSIHTDKDGLVIVENESEYASVVPASNLTTAIVVEAAPTHCGFTGAELVAGWESLRAWVAGAPQPSAAIIQGTCLALAPAFGGPCRIDATYVVADMDTRIRPR